MKAYYVSTTVWVTGDSWLSRNQSSYSKTQYKSSAGHNHKDLYEFMGDTHYLIYKEIHFKWVLNDQRDLAKNSWEQTWEVAWASVP